MGHLITQGVYPIVPPTDDSDPAEFRLHVGQHEGYDGFRRYTYWQVSCSCGWWSPCRCNSERDARRLGEGHRHQVQP